MNNSQTFREFENEPGNNSSVKLKKQQKMSSETNNSNKKDSKSLSGSYKFIHKLSGFYQVMGIIFIIVATILLLTPYLPALWYRINSNAIISERDTLTEVSDKSAEEVKEDIPLEQIDPRPEFDPSLSKTNTLIIESVGINGEIHENDVAEEALRQGIWRVPDYGTPEDPYPIIMASHRFGYLNWDNNYRTLNSFYNLPETSKKDEIKIIWKQREYEYIIYKEEEAEAISDYNADLILYTCKLYNSPVRIFRYANRAY